MAKPYRVSVPRKDEKSGKTYWTNIGVAFPRDRGGMSVILEALPIGREMMIFPPDDGDRAPAGGGAAKGREPGEDDDVPY